MNRKRLRHNIGILVGGVTGLLLIGVLLLPNMQYLYASGPMNVGHEKLACESCHQPGDGKFRQRVQSKIRFILGESTYDAPFQYKKVNNEDCVSCHERASDVHPVFRFFEPKYKKARAAIKPQYCVSCHQEHSGKRVTAQIDFCQECHATLSIKNDKTEISHAELVEKKKWNSCLGCHDYHGNHIMKLNSSIEKQVAKAELKKYFSGQVMSPYSNRKKHQANKTR